MREAAIEKTVTQFAKHQGWRGYKWVSPNNRGVPDRIYFKDGEVKMVEFKAPGKKPTKLQSHAHQELKKEGFEVHVIDSIKAGRALFA